MSVIVVPIVDGVPQVSYRWPAVPSAGDYVIIGHGTPTARRVRVVAPPEWRSDARGECVVDLICKSEGKT